MFVPLSRAKIVRGVGFGVLSGVTKDTINSDYVTLRLPHSSLAKHSAIACQTEHYSPLNS